MHILHAIDASEKGEGERQRGEEEKGEGEREFIYLTEKNLVPV